MKVSIIIVNHNTGSIMNDCIESLYKYEKAGDFEIIIIDNFSNDNSHLIIDNLIRKYPGIKYINTGSLISFSAANNIGIKGSTGEFVLIMNPDIIFTEPVLEKITSEFSADISIGAISPALMGTDNKFQRNYFQRYPSLRQYIYYHSILAKLFNRSPNRMNKYLENQDIDISTGKMYFTEQIPCAFLLTTRNILFNLNLMDENFILFFEDVDLSYRIAEEKRLAVDTSVKITHLGGSSFKNEDNWWVYGRYVKSMIYFFSKHYSTLRASMLKLFVYLNSYLVLFLEIIKIPFGMNDKYRIKKHKYLLSILKEDN